MNRSCQSHAGDNTHVTPTKSEFSSLTRLRRDKTKLNCTVYDTIEMKWLPHRQNFYKGFDKSTVTGN